MHKHEAVRIVPGPAAAAKRHILGSFDDPLGCSTTQIARALGVAPSYLCHAFKERFGITIGAYVRALRIQKAVSLLSTTDLMLKEIAADVGYARTTYRAFLNAFRVETGMSPTEYRTVPACRLRPAVTDPLARAADDPRRSS